VCGRKGKRGNEVGAKERPEVEAYEGCRRKGSAESAEQKKGEEEREGGEREGGLPLQLQS
jgi:hypothetical protein